MADVEENDNTEAQSSQEEEENVDIDVRRSEFTERILDTVEKFMEHKNVVFEKMVEKKISKSGDATIKLAAKKMKSETPELARPGCKDQFAHNTVIFGHVESAEKHIREAEQQELEAGKKQVLERQKLVLLADREENGWVFVKEYVKEKLAEDLEDEKQMARARATSSRKIKGRVQKTRAYRPRPYTLSKTSRTNSSYAQRDNSDNSHQRTFSGRSNYNFRPQAQDIRRNRYDRQCYGCGRIGHLVYNCPDTRRDRY